MANLPRQLLELAYALSIGLCVSAPLQRPEDDDTGELIKNDVVSNEGKDILIPTTRDTILHVSPVRICMLTTVVCAYDTVPGAKPLGALRTLHTSSLDLTSVQVSTDLVHLVMPEAAILIRRPTFPAFYAAMTADEVHAHEMRVKDFTNEFNPRFVYRVTSVQQNLNTLEHPSVLSDHECYVVGDKTRIRLGVGAPLYKNREHVVFPVYAYDPHDSSRNKDRKGGMLVVPLRHIWLDPGQVLSSELDTPTVFFKFHWSRVPLSDHRDVQLAFEKPISRFNVAAISYPSPIILDVMRPTEHEYGWWSEPSALSQHLS